MEGKKRGTGKKIYKERLFFLENRTTREKEVPTIRSDTRDISGMHAFPTTKLKHY